MATQKKRAKKIIKLAKRKKAAKKAVKKAKKVAKRVKKAGVKAAAVAKKVAAKKEKEIGMISHYYDKIGVGVLELTKSPLQVDDHIHILGKNTDFKQTVKSMQLEHESVVKAKKKQSVGLKVNKPVKEKDKVFLAS